MWFLLVVFQKHLKVQAVSLGWKDKGCFMLGVVTNEPLYFPKPIERKSLVLATVPTNLLSKNECL